MNHYLKLMRVQHYIKNLLIFTALLCSGKVFDLKKITTCSIAFISFSMLSSVIYIINDLQDIEKDRNHPVKSKRPIASGLIAKKNAQRVAVILLLTCFLCNSLIFHAESTLILALYFFLNIAYSFGLKKIPIVDVSILVSGFIIRILYGAIITEITVSNWLYLTAITLFYYFALGKRRNELIYFCDVETREVLEAYPVNFLNNCMGMCLTLAIAFYSLWCMDEQTISLYNNEHLVFTVPLVLLITMKYSLDIESKYDGDPVEVLLHDKVLLLFCVLYLLIMFLLLYF